MAVGGVIEGNSKLQKRTTGIVASCFYRMGSVSDSKMEENREDQI